MLPSMFVFLAPLGRQQVTPYSFLAEQMVMAHADGVRLGRAGWRTDSGGPAIAGAKRQGAAKLTADYRITSTSPAERYRCMAGPPDCKTAPELRITSQAERYQHRQS